MGKPKTYRKIVTWDSDINLGVYILIWILGIIVSIVFGPIICLVQLYDKLKLSKFRKVEYEEIR